MATQGGYATSAQPVPSAHSRRPCTPSHIARHAREPGLHMSSLSLALTAASSLPSWMLARPSAWLSRTTAVATCNRSGKHHAKWDSRLHGTGMDAARVARVR